MDPNEVVESFHREMEEISSKTDIKACVGYIENAILSLANQVGSVEICLDNLDNTLDQRLPRVDVGLEAFKTLVPELWNAYCDSPILEFTDKLNNAIKFCELLKDSYPLDLEPPSRSRPTRPHPSELKKT